MSIPAVVPEAAIPREWMTLHRRLLALQERLCLDREHLMVDVAIELGTPGIHPADVGTDEFQRDLDLGLLAAEQDALFEVEEALRRIRAGTYGLCELTGKPIPMERLLAVPWTRFTAEAALALERQHAFPTPHLGQLGRCEAQPVGWPVTRLESEQPSFPQAAQGSDVAGEEPQRTPLEQTKDYL